MKRSRLHLYLLVFFTFSCLYPTATSMLNWILEATVALPTSFTIKWENRPGQQACLVFTTTLPTRSPSGTRYYPQWNSDASGAPAKWQWAYHKHIMFDKNGTATLRFCNKYYPAKVRIVAEYNGKFWPTAPKTVQPIPFALPTWFDALWSDHPDKRNYLVFRTTLPTPSPLGTTYYPEWTTHNAPNTWRYQKATRFDKDGTATVRFHDAPSKVGIVTAYNGKFWHTDPQSVDPFPVQRPKSLTTKWSSRPRQKNVLLFETTFPPNNPRDTIYYPQFTYKTIPDKWFHREDNKMITQFDKDGYASVVFNKL
eukprot:561505_1